MTPADYYSDRVATLSAEGNLRVIPRGDSSCRLVDLSSNDYLGLAARENLRREFFARPEATQLSLTSSASRLLAAGQTPYTTLEDTLSRLYRRPALLFNSGYHANTGIVAALGQAPRTLIVADRLVHASIIDGITLSRAPFTRFRHNDMAHLESILVKERHNYDRFLVITESVFSMDGDSADLEALIDLRERHEGVMLYIDEAHALGCCGSEGLGLAMDSPRRDNIDVIIGTFGKACASVGAFAAVSQELREYLVNTSRSLIFSTALPPLNVAWTDFLMSRLTDFEPERRHLRELGEHLRDILVPLGASADLQPSHIQPLIVGDPHRAVALSQALLERGFKALPIRVPTVPRGTDRLRLSLSAALTHDDLDRFGSALSEVLASTI
ncbi:MAG: 8-amino-7-oxononanoate synthase [Duncaniella sp.]|nr:8-amino-7-oxononanoate synthase [Duncaniella sp.]